MKSLILTILGAIGVGALALPNLSPAADGDKDPSFNVGTGLDKVGYSLAIQPDDSIFGGGWFNNVGGENYEKSVRWEPNGGIDGDFDPPSFDAAVHCSAVQPDGKIIVGGVFTTVGGVTRRRICRLNADGSLDAGFNPDIDPHEELSTDASVVYGLTIQPDGMILVYGRFSRVNGVDRRNICRLFPNGNVDPDFDPDADGAVLSLALRPDGTMIIGGEFTAVGGSARNLIAELDPFGVVLPFSRNMSGIVLSVVIQSDGKILAGGEFITGGRDYHLARFDPSGTLDTGFPDIDFTYRGDSGPVFAMSHQTDGEIIVSGAFDRVNGNARNSVARIRKDGSLDPFDPNLNINYNSADGGIVWGTMLQKDGRVLAIGDFTVVDSAARRIVRLTNGVSPWSISVIDTTHIEWLRGGTSPEAEYVTFELSEDDGATWTVLGQGSRVTGGWELVIAGTPLPLDGMIRAQARTRGGTYSGSQSLLEEVLTYTGGSGSRSGVRGGDGGGGGGGGVDLTEQAEYASGLASYYYYYYGFFGEYNLGLGYHYYYAGQSEYYTQLTAGNEPAAYLAYYNGLALYYYYYFVDLGDYANAGYYYYYYLATGYYWYYWFDNDPESANYYFNLIYSWALGV